MKRRKPRPPKKWLTLDSTFGPVEVYLIPNLTDDNGEPVDGLFIPESFSILLDSKQPPDKARSTLLHEMMHLAFASARVKEKAVDDNEELLISFLEPLLFDLLRRNGFLRMP